MLHAIMALAALMFAFADGGDGGGDGDGGTTDSGAAEATGESPPDLGDAGKKALREERKAKREAEKRAREAESRIAELEAKVTASVSADDREAAIEAARKEAAEAARRETAAEYGARILRTTLVSAATGKLQNPEDAIALIDLSEFDADDDDLRGTLVEAVEALVTEKPYLGVDAAKTKGSADGGAKHSGTPDENLSHMERLQKAYSGN